MISERKSFFSLVVGPADGILTALTLGGSRLLASSAPPSWALALRIAAATSVSTAMVFLIAEYARLRGELIRFEKHLSLRRHGGLALTQLGTAAWGEALRGAAVSAVGSFVGALLPIGGGALMPGQRWVSAAVSVVVLALLGVGIARAVYGRALWWSLVMVVAGVALSLVGAVLRVA